MQNDTQLCKEPDPDVILMDYRMPDIGSVKATGQAKHSEHFRNIPVIFFSPNYNAIECAFEAGADYFL